MIHKIKNIQNVGQFESFNSFIDLEKNVALFGFNGAGKSTLSDIFYSLANDGKEDSIIRRRTLNKESENVGKKINIEIESDIGDIYSFSETEWSSKPKNMYVFNGQYIEDHVFVSRQLEGDAAPIGMGKDGTKYLKQRDRYQEENALLLESINERINNLSNASLKIKDFSATKVTARSNIKKLEKIAKFTLYPAGEKNKILEKIKNRKKYSSEEKTLEMCKEKFETIKNIETFDVIGTIRKIEKTPRISSKQISVFLSQTLKTTDIQWAVKGYKNQKDKTRCPLCGQTIGDKRAIELFNKLGKYVSQNKGDYLVSFSKELYDLASRIRNIRISERVSILTQIVNELDKVNLLLKKDKNKIEKNLKWNAEYTNSLNTIIEKITEKAENPYIDISLSTNENDVLRQLKKVIKNIAVIERVLDDAEARLNKRIDRSIDLDEMGKIYKLSYDVPAILRNDAELIKKNASRYIRNQERILELSVKIDDCYNQSRLNQVNEFLRELNTHLRIEVKNKKYYIRLKKYNPKELLSNLKDTIFSEGESKAVAFAYFLSEILDIENQEEDKTIIIDDPISSMDRSRQSIISHMIADMMNNQKNQVLLLTHDLSFLEKVGSYLDNKSSSQKLEIRAEKEDFLPFNISDYLTNDETVYKNFIKAAETNSSEIDKIIALMSMRPFAYIKKVSDSDYEKIEKASTYYAHTIYCKSNRIKYKTSDYNNKKIKSYIRMIKRSTKCDFDVDAIAGNYCFAGFDFNKIASLYSSVPLDCIDNMRKKMLLMRPLIEACIFQFSAKSKIDAEHIGKIIQSTIRANSSDPKRKRMCEELKELYDATKKYHHGADEGSLLGISWINPSEVEYFDDVVMSIVSNIRDNKIVKPIAE